MAKFRKKPVVIEALQYTGTNVLALKTWAHLGLHPAMNEILSYDGCSLRCRTLESATGESLVVSPGDWIIRGVKGEFYPCKPDIFAAAYEPVPAAEGGTPESPA